MALLVGIPLVALVAQPLLVLVMSNTLAVKGPTVQDLSGRGVAVVQRVMRVTVGQVDQQHRARQLAALVAVAVVATAAEHLTIAEVVGGLVFWDKGQTDQPEQAQFSVEVVDQAVALVAQEEVLAAVMEVVTAVEAAVQQQMALVHKDLPAQEEVLH